MTYDSFTRNIENHGLRVEIEGNNLLVTDEQSTLARISSVDQGDYHLMEFTNQPLIFLSIQLSHTPIKDR